ncbi:MAG: YggT family protein [Bacillota bacterium]
MEFVIVTLYRLIDLYSWALIIYIFMSWFPNARETAIGRFLARICEPYLEPFRKIVPSIGMIDISPIVAFITLNLAKAGIVELSGWIL